MTTPNIVSRIRWKCPLQDDCSASEDVLDARQPAQEEDSQAALVIAAVEKVSRIPLSLEKQWGAPLPSEAMEIRQEKL